MASPAMPRVGWADAGVGERRLLGRLVVAGEGQGREHHRRVPAAGQPQQALETGEGHEQVGQHPRPLAALAGEQERHPARIGAGAPAPSPADEHAVAGGTGPQPLDLGRQVVEVVGHDGRADRRLGGARPGTVTAGDASRRCRARSRSAQGRPALSLAAMRSASRSTSAGPRKRNSSAGHSSRPWAGSAAPS